MPLNNNIAMFVPKAQSQKLLFPFVDWRNLFSRHSKFFSSHLHHTKRWR